MPTSDINKALLLDILEVVNVAKSYGFNTVKDEIQNWETYTLLTDNEFKRHWDVLIENMCLLRNANHQSVRLNPDKDCIKNYEQIIADEKNDKLQSQEINRLILENLQYERTVRDLKEELLNLSKELQQAQKDDIPKNAEDRKTISGWTVAIAAIAITEFVLLIFGVSLKP